jgi:small subunit ribosomal protein S17
MKTLVGKIVSNKMDHTVTVLIERLWQHPVYLKRIKRSHKLLAHTDDKLKEGLTVKIGEVKPISKRKTWKVLEVVEK